MPGQQYDLKLNPAMVLADVTVAQSAYLGSLIIFICSFPFLFLGTGFFIVIGAVFIVLAFIDATNIATLTFTTSCAADNDKLIVRYGLIRPIRAIIPASAIRHINVDQSWIGSKLKYGSIIILGDDLGIRLQYIKDPQIALSAIKNSITLSTARSSKDGA